MVLHTLWMNFDPWTLKFDLWTAKAAWKHTDGPEQLLTFSSEPVLHTGPTGVTGTRTMTTDPTATTGATGLTGQRLMATDSTATRATANGLTGSRHVGFGLSGDRTMATDST